MEDGLDARTEAVRTEFETEAPEDLDSAALARILEEVRNEDVPSPTSYNRMHNRHNRS